MSVSAIAQLLSEGNPRSLGRVREVIDLVLKDPKSLGELFECLFNNNDMVRMRAGDAIERICKQHPEWFGRYKSRLLNEVVNIEQPSVEWHLAQILGEINLSAAEKDQATKILFGNLRSDNDWIVINYSLETLAKFAKTEEKTKQKLLEQLNKLQYSSYKSIASRSKRLLGLLQ